MSNIKEFTLSISEEGAKDLARYHRRHMLRQMEMYFQMAIVLGVAGFICGFSETSSVLVKNLVLISQVGMFAGAALAVVMALVFLYCGLKSGKGLGSPT